MIKQILIAACICLLSSRYVVGQDFEYPPKQCDPVPRCECKDDFAITPPKEPDAPGCKNPNSYRAMSPDSWDVTVDTKRDNSNDWAPPSDKATPSDWTPPADWAKSSTPADKTIEEKKTGEKNSGSGKSPFQSASFPRKKQEVLPDSPEIPKSILSPSAQRYPLKQESSVDEKPSVLQMPAADVPAAPSNNSQPYGALSGIDSPSIVAPGSNAYLVRNWGSPDHGEKFDFENKKKESPPLSEILATGRYFGSATLLYLKTGFQGNTAITETISGINTPFDFDYEAAPQFQFGFESKHGPGFEFNYWQYDEASNPAFFTSDGVESGSTSISLPGSNRFSVLTASNFGETLSAIHAIDVETASISFFKEIQFPVSRLNGKFGYQYASIRHDIDATVTDGGGSVVGVLRGVSDMRGWGPIWRMEYFRPVGHTKLEIVTRFGGSALFGQQDQLVASTTDGELSRLGADEFITMFDFMTGVQYKKYRGENQCILCRVGYNFQTWLGGGTAILPQEDFGLRGWSFTFGFNR